MDTSERIFSLRRAGFSTDAIGAILDLSAEDVTSHGLDPALPNVEASGGGGGFTPPGPVSGLDFAIGDDPATVGIEPDPINENPGWLGLFPRNGGVRSGLTAYDANLDAAGNFTEPNATYAGIGTRPGRATVFATQWARGAGGSLTCASESGDETGPFVGLLTLNVDPDATPTTSSAIRIESAALELSIDYRGYFVWQFGNLGRVTLIASVAAPTYDVGQTGDWALGGNGHLYWRDPEEGWIQKL